MSSMKRSIALVGLLGGLGAGAASAHMTPPVVLHSEKEVVAAATRGAAKIAVREIRLTDAERGEVARRSGWRPPAGVQRFYVGRDGSGKALSAVTFLSEFTIHGPVRVGVAIGPDGKVRDVQVIELTEETNAAFKPLLDRGFAKELVGASARPALPTSAANLEPQSISRFYAQIVTDMVGRAVVLYDVAFAGPGEKK
jgi:hypothetical protein